MIVKGHGIELNERLRDYAESKLTKSQRFFDRIIQVEVELSEERNPRVSNRHKVDVTVKTPIQTIRATGAGTDYFAAIDQAEQRLERQVIKLKGRLSNRGRAADNHQEPPDVARVDDDDETAIVRTTQAAVKPMTPEEAVLELEGRGLQFMLFTNSETMGPGVIYRRSDGAYGLVEQEL